MKIIALNKTARMNRQCILMSIEHKRSLNLLEHLQLIATIHLLLLILSLLSNSLLFDLSFFFNCCSLYHLQRQYVCYADWFTRDLRWQYKSKQWCNDWRRCWERIDMLDLRFHCHQNFNQRSWRSSKWRRLIVSTDCFWSAYYMISSQSMMTSAICKEWQRQILTLLMINISNIHLISCLRFASLLADAYS